MDKRIIKKKEGQKMSKQTKKNIGHKAIFKNENNNRLFDIYNLQPNKHEGHKIDMNIYGSSPKYIDSFFYFKPSDGSTGLIPDPDVVKSQEDLINKPFDSVISKKVDQFKISYTVSYPERLVTGKYKLMILLHGVPTQKNQKYEVMRHLSRFDMICVAPDMLGMGESDQIHEYKSAFEDPKRGNHQKWDWNHDVDWINQMITHIKNDFPEIKNSDIIFQADDWGAGIALYTATASGAGKFEMNDIEYPFDHKISMMIIVNGIVLDGYYVREIGAIGRTSGLESGPFTMMMGGFDQTAVQIEKQMIYNRAKMNNYTERDFLGQYADVNYQSGKMAVDQGIKFWNVKTLADRAGRLAPRTLQPYHTDKDGLQWGIKFQNIKCPSLLVWGTEDQMMPPTQMDRLSYLLSLNHQRCYIQEIAKADHFSEWDRPEAVARAMLRTIRTEFGPDFIPVFVGNDPEAVYKGDEKKFVEKLQNIF